MKAHDVKPNTLFKYYGKTYQWIKKSEGWAYLCDEQGNKIPPTDIPMNILLNKADVEVIENVNKS